MVISPCVLTISVCKTKFIDLKVTVILAGNLIKEFGMIIRFCVLFSIRIESSLLKPKCVWGGND